MNLKGCFPFTFGSSWVFLCPSRVRASSLSVQIALVEAEACLYIFNYMTLRVTQFPFSGSRGAPNESRRFLEETQKSPNLVAISNFLIWNTLNSTWFDQIMTKQQIYTSHYKWMNQSRHSAKYFPIYTFCKCFGQNCHCQNPTAHIFWRWI